MDILPNKSQLEYIPVRLLRWEYFLRMTVFSAAAHNYYHVFKPEPTLKEPVLPYGIFSPHYWVGFEILGYNFR
jgi:hypothetical protein